MIALVILGSQPARLPGLAQAQPPAQKNGEHFGLTKVWSIHLDIPAREFEAK